MQEYFVNFVKLRLIIISHMFLTEQQRHYLKRTILSANQTTDSEKATLTHYDLTKVE